MRTFNEVHIDKKLLPEGPLAATKTPPVTVFEPYCNCGSLGIHSSWFRLKVLLACVSEKAAALCSMNLLAD